MTLVATAAQLSKAVIDIAGRYKNAKRQVDSFGQEVGTLGNNLGSNVPPFPQRQMLKPDAGVHSIPETVLGHCSDFFSELEAYRNTFYSRLGSARSLLFRGRKKMSSRSSGNGIFICARRKYI